MIYITIKITNLYKKTIEDYPNLKFKNGGIIDKNINLLTYNHTGLGNNLFQISKPFPLKELKPIYDWINYNEPEEHLDKLVNTISKLKYVNKKSTISGVSYKEISTISRFFRKGYNKNWILNPYVDLKIKDKKHNLETIQKKNFINIKF